MTAVVGRATGATWRWLRSAAPEWRTLTADAVAGLPGAVGIVLAGMAASVLAGVNALRAWPSPAVTSSPPVDPDAGQHPGVLQRCPGPSDAPEHDDHEHAETQGKAVATVPFHEVSLRWGRALVFIPCG
jgi:hypothetical protein